MSTRSKRAVRYLALVLLGLLHVTAGNAAVDPAKLTPPPAGTIQVLTTLDGSTLVGRIVGLDGDAVTFETESGTLTVPTANIVSIEIRNPDRIRNGRYWHPDPAATRLFVFPTGRMLGKGRGYFSDHELFFPALDYGVTNWLTVSGGGSLFPGVEADEQVYYLSARIGQAVNKKFAYSFQTLMVRVPKIDDDIPEWVKLFNAVGTYGGPDASVTAGLGYGLVGSEAADRPLILLGGSKRLSRRIVAMSENWLLPGVDDFAILYGIRFIGEDLSADLGFVTITDEDAFFPGLPLITIAYSF